MDHGEDTDHGHPVNVADRSVKKASVNDCSFGYPMTNHLRRPDADGRPACFLQCTGKVNTNRSYRENDTAQTLARLGAGHRKRALNVGPFKVRLRQICQLTDGDG